MLDFNHLNNEINLDDKIYNILNHTSNLAAVTSNANAKYSYVIGSNSTSVNVTQSRTELDSHADTCTVGKNALITHVHNRQVNVHAYDPTMGSQQNMSIVNAAVAYDCPHTGEVIILKINQAIQINTMSNNLLCIMQLRTNDVKVFDCPKYLTESPTVMTHSVIVPPNEGDNCNLSIPLSLKGVTSFFHTRKPSLIEYEMAEAKGRSYDLTYDSPDWDPHSPTFTEQEEAVEWKLDATELGLMSMTAASILDNNFVDRGLMVSETLDTYMVHAPNTVYARSSECSSVLSEISPTLCDDSFLSLLQSNVQVSFNSTKGSSEKAINQLVQNWGIGTEAAKRTVQATTQRVIRSVAHPSLSRRFRSNDRQLRYRRINAEMFTDTGEANIISKRGNKYTQFFSLPYGWVRAFSMPKKSSAHEALSLLFKNDGVPTSMVMDGSKEQTLGAFRTKCRQAGCHVKQTEPYSPWSNSCEVAIKECKLASGRDLRASKCPKKLWDDCLERRAYIRSFTAHDIYSLMGEVPDTLANGETPDISEFSCFKWYQWVKYRDQQVSYPDDNFVLGRYLCPSTDIGPAMTCKLLNIKGNYLHRSTVRALTPDELMDPLEIKAREAFDKAIEEKLGPAAKPEDFSAESLDCDTPQGTLYEDDSGGGSTPMLERDDITDDHYDQYLNAEVLLPIRGKMQTGKVARRKRDDDGNLKGKAHSKATCDTREYVVQFPDGAEASYSANLIAENMYAQCDIAGNQYILMKSIVDYKKDKSAISVKGKYATENGKTYLVRTTKGWKLCVSWRDGSSSWETLSTLKESNPVEVAEFAVAQGIDHEPAFAWWVPYTLKKRDSIIAAVNARYHKRTHKYGIELPKSVADCKRLDDLNGNTLWQDAIAAEINAVRVAFKIKHGDEKIPPGYQYIRCHMIFDVKMEDFRRKARYVAQGNMTEAPATLTYASVVSRESVRIALTLAALNDLEVKTADIKNAYLTAPVSELIWTILGPEFGPDSGKKALVVRALYGLKSAGAAFRNHLADCMDFLGYQSCLADPDLWLKAEINPANNHKYYAYILLYVDDVLCIHHDGEKTINIIDRYFKMKDGSIGDPDMYLGAKLRKTRLPNGVEAWATSPSKYVNEAVKNVESYLMKEYDGRTLKKRAGAPFIPGYKPELDLSPELDSTKSQYYQSLIGILQWMVEIGRIDMITEVNMMAFHVAMPREGHLENIFHMFAYLKIKHNSRMVFDPSYPKIDMTSFRECEWKHFYKGAKEAIPENAPEPRGKEVDLRCFVDADHAGDTVTRRSRTGFFIFINMAPVIFYSKKQTTIESSVFGSEFVAMKVAMETSRGLRYKLRMMGVPICGPTYMYGDNMSVIHNTQKPESTLKKKSNSICYHAVREAVAMGETLTAHVRSHENVADIATKVLHAGQKRDYLVSQLLYDLAD